MASIVQSKNSGDYREISWSTEIVSLPKDILEDSRCDDNLQTFQPLNIH